MSEPPESAVVRVTRLGGDHATETRTFLKHAQPGPPPRAGEGAAKALSRETGEGSVGAAGSSVPVVTLIEIDNPPANVLSAEVRRGLEAALLWAIADADTAGIVLACAGRTFVAGADIREFGQPPAPPLLPAIVALIEESPKPVVAALHGTALGGGFELALAAHRRIAHGEAKMGLPEVKLGLVPGAGGTQRLPRLSGIPAALEMITGGRPIGAHEARELGIVDAVVDGDLSQAAILEARALAGAAPRRTGSLPVPSFDRDASMQIVAAITKKARGAEAPGEAARLVLAAADLPLDMGLAAEREAFQRLRESPQSAALRHLFFAEREAVKHPTLVGVAACPIRLLGIVGAGLMGAGIAAAAADAGLDVIVVEQSLDAAAAGRARIEGIFAQAIAAKRIDAEGAAARLRRIEVVATLAPLADADIVIEAVFDDLAVKRDLFRALDGVLRPDAVLATNTSYLDPDDLAAATGRADHVIGLHFFSPANIMRLVEIVWTREALPVVVATGIALARRLGKLPVLCGVGEGFIGNRVFSSYRRECEFMLEEGALPHEIDAALEAHGFALGPFATQDMVGHEISWARRRRQAETRDAGERYCVIPDRLCEAGRLGRKSGRGWYRYQDGRRQVDPEVTALIEAVSAETGNARRPFGAEEIVTRVIANMAVTGVRLLEEGVAHRSGDIDLVLVNGYGYPAWRGGPMFEAAGMGLA